MYICQVCDKEFLYPSVLAKHQTRNKTCNRLLIVLNNYVKENEELKNKLVKSNKKKKEIISFLKILLREKDLIIKENERAKEKYNELKNAYEQKIQELHDMTKQLCIAETKADERSQAVKTVGTMIKDTAVEMSKNSNKTINKNTTTNNNNNNIVIQDFVIKPLSFDQIDIQELTQFIYDHGVTECCQYMLEKYYWTLPPNIRVADQARKKVMVMEDNQWVQKNLKELSHKLVQKSFKKAALHCIRWKRDEHKNLLKCKMDIDEDVNDNEEFHHDEISKWNCIEETWDKYNTEEFQKPLMMSVDNLYKTDETKSLRKLNIF